MQGQSAKRLLDDKRFKLDYDFFYRAQEMANVSRYGLTEVKLKDIRREWKGALIPRSECYPYKYLSGEVAQYHEYVRENASIHVFEMSKYHFAKLRQSVETQYNEQKEPVLTENNILYGWSASLWSFAT